MCPNGRSWASQALSQPPLARRRWHMDVALRHCACPAGRRYAPRAVRAPSGLPSVHALRLAPQKKSVIWPRGRRGLFRTFRGHFWTIEGSNIARNGHFWTMEGSNIALDGLFRTFHGLFWTMKGSNVAFCRFAVCSLWPLLDHQRFESCLLWSLSSLRGHESNHQWPLLSHRWRESNLLWSLLDHRRFQCCPCLFWAAGSRGLDFRRKKKDD